VATIDGASYFTGGLVTSDGQLDGPAYFTNGLLVDLTLLLALLGSGQIQTSALARITKLGLAALDSSQLQTSGPFGFTEAEYLDYIRTRQWFRIAKNTRTADIDQEVTP
jgi:hypothetical protein